MFVVDSFFALALTHNVSLRGDTVNKLLMKVKVPLDTSSNRSMNSALTFLFPVILFLIKFVMVALGSPLSDIGIKIAFHNY